VTYGSQLERDRRACWIQEIQSGSKRSVKNEMRNDGLRCGGNVGGGPAPQHASRNGRVDPLPRGNGNIGRDADIALERFPPDIVVRYYVSKCFGDPKRSASAARNT